jgi:hypothetical protein
MTAAEFTARFGFAPTNDDLDRVACPQVGAWGHWLCGVCAHDKPRWLCEPCTRIAVRGY